MTLQSVQFGHFLHERIDAIADDILQSLKQESIDYRNSALNREGVIRVLTVIATSLEQEDEQVAVAFANTLGQQRAQENFSLESLLAGFEILRTYIWICIEQSIERGISLSHADIRTIDNILFHYHYAFFHNLSNLYDQRLKALHDQEQEITDQRAIINQLSTPIVPIYEGILILPLHGMLDTKRATLVLEAALEQISQYQADTLLVDITGVPVVDTHVAGYIATMARAVTLLGANIVLVGISPEMAQTFVQLEIDLDEVITFARLETGLTFVLKQRGLAIQPCL